MNSRPIPFEEFESRISRWCQRMVNAYSLASDFEAGVYVRGILRYAAFEPSVTLEIGTGGVRFDPSRIVRIERAQSIDGFLDSVIIIFPGEGAIQVSLEDEEFLSDRANPGHAAVR